MFAAGSIKTSKWGWDFKGYTERYDPSYSQTGGTVGAWSPLTLAPNGFYYALPRVWVKNGGLPANDVLCFKPGKSNNKTNKWEPAQIILVPAGSGQKQPNLPSFWPNTIASQQYRFPSKGVLAPNGLIYFFGINERSYVRLTPQADPNANTLTATQWDVFKYNQTSPQIDPTGDGTTSASGSFYSGGILGRDGYIYLIPSTTITNSNFPSNFVRQRTVRIAPRNTAINPNNEDVIELGYYNTSTGVRVFNRNYVPPRPYAWGIDINGTELTVPSDLTATAYGPVGNSLSNGIVHPNGKIYLFGGASKRIYILDPTKWGLNTEIYTNNNIYIPNVLSASPGRGWFGQGFTATLEKLRPGQDPNTLKIIFGYGGNAQSTTNETNKVYTASIIFDPVTESFTSNYDATTNEGLTILPSATGPSAINASSSLINLPNGHIFQSTYSVGGGVDGTRNLYGKLIYFKGDQLKYIGPQKRNILSSLENVPIYSKYTNIAGDGGWASATPGIKSSFGKTIYSSINGACEITSVKGYYPRIKHFSYDDNSNSSFTSTKNTINNVMYPSSNQVKLFGVDLTGVLSSGKPFCLESPALGYADPFIISNVSLSGSDTVVTVSGTPFYPLYETFVQGVDFISDTQLTVSMTYEEYESGIPWSNKKIYIEGLNSGYFTTTTFLYTSGNETLTLTFPAGTFEDTGNDTNARLYYADPAIDEGSTFTYGQLIGFPIGGDTLKIYGVDLTNSMYNVLSVTVSGSSISSNNGVKLRYQPTPGQPTPPNYVSGYTELTFALGTFTEANYEPNVTMSFQYAFNDSDIYDIPSDISALPTSLYNAYFNKPR